jgi:hypothetical protein
LKEEALDCTMWRNRFGRDFGPVVRQNTEWMNTWNLKFKGLWFGNEVCYMYMR